MPAREPPFWERPDTVSRFAGRQPDHRLRELVTEFAEPSRTRVLDLGCAGGRNTVFLAERGFDVIAIDASRAMVAETRRRVADVLGEEEADSRVRVGRMDHLEVEGASFALVVALGVYHSASRRREWERALGETQRVLEPGGRVLVANHTDEFDPDGRGLAPLAGEPHVFERTSGRSFLVSAEELDREMERAGFVRLAPTETVRRPTEEGGVRVTANGLYGKRRGPDAAESS